MVELENLLNRKSNLFCVDIYNNSEVLCDIISSSSFLIIGGAGSIGQAVAKEIFKRHPKRIDIVDINENNLKKKKLNLQNGIH